MRLGHVGLVYRKELLDTLRDRRTLISSILVPLLLFPVLTIGVGGLAIFLAIKATQSTARVMVLGAEGAPELLQRIRKEKNFEIVPPADDYVRQINDKKLRAAVEFPGGLEENLKSHPEEMHTVKVYWYDGELRSQDTVRKIEKIVRDYREEVVQSRLAARGLPSDVLQPFQTERKNVAPAEKVTGNILGLILPYFVIILCLTGALYPAIDLTAGEKERGTMETILASPLRRTELVGGKFLVVLSASVTTAALSILSFAITVLGGAGLLARLEKNFVLAVSSKAAAAVFFIILPLAVLFSAGLMAIALFARSYREAQTYTAPLLIVVILPAMASFVPGVELNPKLALIPILNVSLAAKEIFGGVYHWPLLGLIFGSTCVYAAAAMAFAVWQFQREEVLFRT